MGILDIFKGYPVQVVIFEKRGNSYRIKEDRARRKVTEEGKHEYELQKAKDKTKPKSYDTIYIDSKGKDRLFLFSPQTKVYHPMTLKQVITQIKNETTGEILQEVIDMEELTPLIDESERKELVMDQEERFQRYKERAKHWLEQILPYGMLIATFVLGLIMLSKITKDFTPIAKSMESMAISIESASKNFVGMQQACNGITAIPGKPPG